MRLGCKKTLRLTSELYCNSRPIEKITYVTDVREICTFLLIEIILSVYFYTVTDTHTDC
jgi:hypothetical protein